MGSIGIYDGIPSGNQTWLAGKPIGKQENNGRTTQEDWKFIGKPWKNGGLPSGFVKVAIEHGH